MQTAPTAPVTGFDLPVDRDLIHLPAQVALPGVTEEEATYVATDLSRFKREAIEFALVRIRSLSATGKHRYRGTVTPKVKADRRARGKVAKASRKVNR